MDAFVHNLFQDIDIPDSLVDAENVIESPFRCPSFKASPIASQTDSLPSRLEDTTPPVVEIKPYVSPTRTRKSAISAGLSLNRQAKGLLQNKRPINSLSAPFVAPEPCKPEPCSPADPYKKPKQEHNGRYTDSLSSLSGGSPVASVPSPEEMRPIAERYPLQGPAGVNVFSLLSNVIMNGTQDAADGMNKGENSWMKAMRILESSDLAQQFKSSPDFPEGFTVNEYVTQKFNIKWIISEAHMYQFGFRMEWLVVFIVSQKTMGLHVMCVLMDKSGQMLGYINEELRNKFKHIAPGSTLILRNVFVYNPVGYKPYLVIRPNDVVKVVRN